MWSLIGQDDHFIQSYVPQQTQLAWILSCICNQYSLNYMIQYKQKKKQSNYVGIYTYPILIASDILFYKTTHVPVGMDQVQHLELTNKIRQRINRIIRIQLFPYVNYIKATQSKIISLSNPYKKMSKRDENQKSRINITDSQAKVYEKIKKAVTNSLGDKITYDSFNRKILSSLINIYSTLIKDSPEQIANQLNHLNISIRYFKQRLSAELQKILSQIQYIKKHIKDEEVYKIIHNGAQQARNQASLNLKQLKRILQINIL